MRMSAPRLNSDFDKVCSDCFANRQLLKENIDDVDYELSDSPRNNITIKDLFLGGKGRQCVFQLVRQMKLQFKLYYHIRRYKQGTSEYDDTNLQLLLNECKMPWACMEMLENHDDHKELRRIEDREETTYVYLGDPDAGIAINCESLIDFVDRFLYFINERLQNHQEECSRDLCPYCISLPDLEEKFQEISPLLQDFGIYSSSNDIQLGEEFETIQVEIESLSLKKDDVTSNNQFSIKFDDTVEAAIVQDEYTWEHFSEIVLNKFNDLTKHYSEYADAKEGHPVALLYSDSDGNIKEVGCQSVTEAREQANRINGISQDPFPVVLITPTDNRQTSRLPNVPSRKRMIQKCSSKVGVEDSPSIVGTLKAPEGRKPFEVELLFYLDTGADSGSIGYNLHIIRHFVLTAENINNKLTPAIICKVNIANNMDEDIQVFDVDENQTWNAIGLSVLKNYRIYIDIKNNKVELGKHEDVTEMDTDDLFQVTFRKDVHMLSLTLGSNGEDL